MEKKPLRLGEMLLQAGLIDQFQLESALSLHRNVGGQTGRALVKLGYLSEETILEFLTKQSQFSRVDLRSIMVPKNVMSLIPFAKLHEKLVFPIALRTDGAAKTLEVAMTDPTDLTLIDDLQFIAGCRVRAVVAPEAEIRSALNRYDPAKKQVVTQSDPDYDFQDISHRLGGEDEESVTEDRFDRLVGILERKGILSKSEVEQLLSSEKSL